MNTTTKGALGSEHPSFSNAEAYSYIFPQSVSISHPLSTYSDACWGSQMGHTVCEGSFLPLFNNHSMSGKIFFWSDGFIAGPIVGLEKISLSRPRRSSRHWHGPGVARRPQSRARRGGNVGRHRRRGHGSTGEEPRSVLRRHGRSVFYPPDGTTHGKEETADSKALL